MSEQYIVFDGDWIAGREDEYRRLAADLLGDGFDQCCEICVCWQPDRQQIRVLGSTTGAGWEDDWYYDPPAGWDLPTVIELLENGVYFRPDGIEECPDEAEAAGDGSE